MSFEEFKNLSDIKLLSKDELPKFCEDLRRFLIETVSKTINDAEDRRQ